MTSKSCTILGCLTNFITDISRLICSIRPTLKILSLSITFIATLCDVTMFLA
uniref:Uncharacterized protein n=1 Tax=Arundo donax TaxID=35708 RepID=A0A0A9ERE3_ARUDO